MVVFTCNSCGESLKKNQVEKHYNSKCRSCNVLSCLDCGKDFWGNEYEQHTKCISEEEKYSGKNFVPKPGANKNEIKQQQWFHQVQQAIDKAKANPQLRDLLEKLKDFPNVPRKEKKFMNFLSSSLNCRNHHTSAQAWKVLMEGVEKPKQDEKQGTDDKQNSVQQTTKEAEPAKVPEPNGNTATNGVEDSEESGKTLSKRERKEERRKKLHKTEKKDKQTKEAQENGDENLPRQKKKKRKRDEEDDIPVDESRLVANETVNSGDEEEEAGEPVKKKFKTKFDWTEVIMEVLNSKGPEIKTKKLKKKVLAEYLSQGCTEKSEEKLWAKFDKRVKKIPGVKVIGDKVKLTNPKS